ncbi:MAG TPA: hypothetical protein VN880_12090 [Solirubrobacteraceae bacterium]|nr:hypothetical protein [Solirubrobacteraceae bacterium]
MSIRTADAGAGALAGPRSTRAVSAARDYFLSDSRRSIQTVLGLVWLLDGALQFQSFMYSHGFIDMLTQMIPGQPSWLGSSMRWASHIAAGNLDLYNTLFALTQVLIGLGLLYRRTVRPALAVSFVWALVVWWFGEAFGMLFMNMANPLTGAPGAVLLYGIVGLIVWPGDRPGGLLGVRGARMVWAVLWVLMGGLWLLGANSTANATTTAINAAPSGMSWLSTVQNWGANAASGNGLIIAVVLAVASCSIGVAVARNWHARAFLIAAIVLNLAYWVVGQGLGGIFQGGATDPNAGPLFVLLALALYPLVPIDDPVPEPRLSAQHAQAEPPVHAGAAL